MTCTCNIPQELRMPCKHMACIILKLNKTPFQYFDKIYTTENFKKMVQIKDKTNLKELSMGMSNDYIEAAKNSATYVRIGSKIFGARD